MILIRRRLIAVRLCTALAVISLAKADTLPGSCGPVGLERYQGRGTNDAVTSPPLVLARGTALTVTNAGDVVNGNVSSPAALIANPGTDGISLREALLAVNQAPGSYTIGFAPSLKGSTIQIGQPGLPPLTGGGVIVNGDIDGDGKPDIQLDAGGAQYSTIQVSSSDVTLYALSLKGFTDGVQIRPVAAGQTYSNIAIANLVIRSSNDGIVLGADQFANSRFVNVTISGNDVEAPNMAISAMLALTDGNSLDGINIVHNTVRGGPGAAAVSLVAGNWPTGSDNSIHNAVISGNTITGPTTTGIRIGSGDIGSSRNRVDHVRISGNTISLEAGSEGEASGIMLVSGDTSTDWVDPSFRPVGYPLDNDMGNVEIAGNVVAGENHVGIGLAVGYWGAERSTMHDVSVLGNSIDGVSTTSMDLSGIKLLGGWGVNDAEHKPATAGRISNVVIEANRVRLRPDPTYSNAGGIVLLGADAGATGNQVQDIWVSHNDVDAGPEIDINVLGGAGSATFPGTGAAPIPTDNNVISGVEVWCNLAGGPPPEALSPAFARRLTVAGGAAGATGNRVEAIRLQQNLVGGILNDSAFLSDADPGSTGNQVTPARSDDGSPDVNPYGIVSVATARNEPLSPGSIASLYGINLAAAPMDSPGTPLPASISNASVSIGGIAAPIYYVSPGLINFQVPWDLAGQQAFLSVSYNGRTGIAQPVALAPADPGLLAADGSGAGQGVIAATGTGALAAPAGAFPGSGPVSRGDYVVIYATGLGVVQNPLPSGAAASATVLSPLANTPSVTIGGVPAYVQFAGLAPGFVGLYQINVCVPQSAPSGDAVAVMLSVGGFNSNTVTIAIR
jgi:uncharacterized protein (TIGR03437 family)